VNVGLKSCQAAFGCPRFFLKLPTSRLKLRFLIQQRLDDAVQHTGAVPDFLTNIRSSHSENAARDSSAYLDSRDVPRRMTI
jgi:hypothetical protein